MSRKAEIFFFFAVLIVFASLVNKYYIDSPVLYVVSNQVNVGMAKLDYWFGRCPSNEIRINVPGGYVCRTETGASQWRQIYDEYPKSGGGKEVVYEFLNRGSIEMANQLLNNQYAVARFDPVKIDEITWQEDPYDEQYWRFLFYSLRFTRNLVYANDATGDKVYANKLAEIIEGCA